MDKRILFSISLSIVLAACLTFASFADVDSVKVSNENKVQAYEGNEFEMILELRNTPVCELQKLGFTEKEISEVKSDALEKELLKRAKLPEEVLKAYGYNEEQILLLKKYKGEIITSDSEYTKLSASCSGYFWSGDCTNKKIRLRYSWEWSGVPVVKMTDKVFVRWQAVKTGGVVVDATVTYAKATVKYYYLPTGAYASSKDTTVSGSGGTVSDYRTFNIKMIKDDNYWAKKGTAKITLSSEAAGFKFKYVDVGGAYGHKKITGTISFSFPASTHSWVQFTPKLVVKQETDNDGRIFPSGTVNNYH